MTLHIVVERVQASSYLSWRWHPHALDPHIDYSSEPTTRVEFTLMEVPGGTFLKVVESGFDALPDSRRAEAYRSKIWRRPLPRSAMRRALN